MRISSVFQNLFMYPLKSIQQNNVVKFHHQVTNDLVGPFLDLLLQNLIWQSFLLTSQYSPSGIYTCGIQWRSLSSSFHLYYIHVPQSKTISFLVDFKFQICRYTVSKSRLSAAFHSTLMAILLFCSQSTPILLNKF